MHENRETERERERERVITTKDERNDVCVSSWLQKSEDNC